LSHLIPAECFQPVSNVLYWAKEKPVIRKNKISCGWSVMDLGSHGLVKEFMETE
jgi:hypothetical protein